MVPEINKMIGILRNRELSDKILGDDIETPEYYGVFKQLYKLLYGLRKRAEAGVEFMKAGEENQARLLKNKMHDQVSDFSFDELMKNIKDPEAIKVHELPEKNPVVEGAAAENPDDSSPE